MKMYGFIDFDSPKTQKNSSLEKLKLKKQAMY